MEEWLRGLLPKQGGAQYELGGSNLGRVFCLARSAHFAIPLCSEHPRVSIPKPTAIFSNQGFRSGLSGIATP
jgi:hypothetical protein